ncbi:hypothetical protein [Streptomyces sp. NPDC002825]|uniref:hypothetical protein n=1 Tax=Streptomyces sp. NPDC002825 TaxID=3154666 RepID=UPI003329D628
MADFRAEAIEAYETTRSKDTRGIIAALLHLAETIAPAGTNAAPVPGAVRWQKSALAYLQGRSHRDKTADRIARWLGEQGLDVDLDEVKRGMWQLVEAGLVKANTVGMNPTFSAVSEKH